MPVLVLGFKDVQELLPMRECVPLMAAALRSLAPGPCAPAFRHGQEHRHVHEDHGHDVPRLERRDPSGTPVHGIVGAGLFLMARS